MQIYDNSIDNNRHTVSFEKKWIRVEHSQMKLETNDKRLFQIFIRQTKFTNLYQSVHILRRILLNLNMLINIKQERVVLKQKVNAV